MKATELLKKQHREVSKLFKQACGTDNARERRRACDDIVQMLKTHTAIEEEIFYPAVRGLGTKKAEEMVGEAIEEHHVVDLVLAELPQIDPSAETFHAKITVLSELVKHHVEEEEKAMFTLADRLGQDELKALAQQMAARAEDGQRHERRRRAS